MYAVPQCGMANPHGENPGAVSILHAMTEETWITLNYVQSRYQDVLYQEMDIAGTVGNVRKCRIVSTL